MNRLFRTAPIAADSWLRIVGVAAAALAVVELEKWLRGTRRRSSCVPWVVVESPPKG